MEEHPFVNHNVAAEMTVKVLHGDWNQEALLGVRTCNCDLLGILFRNCQEARREIRLPTK